MSKPRKLLEFDKAEHARITEEILKDRELQFKLFWQSIAVTVAVFSLCINLFQDAYWIRFPFMILAPHLILVPTATIILNRARTANRKSGYLLVAFDQFSDAINWEKHLSVLRNHSNKLPHRAATIRSMLFAITFLEIVALIVYLITLFVGTFSTEDELSPVTWVLLIAGLIYMGFYGYFIVSRYQSYFCTKYSTSIQGYATKWVDALNLDKSALKAGHEWSEENWVPSLQLERERYWILKLLWWFIWKEPKNLSGRWRFEKSIIKPVLLSMVIYGLVAGFSYHSIRNVTSTKSRISKRQKKSQNTSQIVIYNITPADDLDSLNAASILNTIRENSPKASTDSNSSISNK